MALRRDRRLSAVAALRITVVAVQVLVRQYPGVTMAVERMLARTGRFAMGLTARVIPLLVAQRQPWQPLSAVTV